MTPEEQIKFAVKSIASEIWLFIWAMILMISSMWAAVLVIHLVWLLLHF